MKQTYFTEDTLQKQAAHFIAQVGGRPRQAEIDTPALLVLDMQRYFLEPDSHAFVTSAPAIIPNILNLIDTFQAHHLPVVYTRHINTPQNAGGMSRWWRDVIAPDHPHAGLAAPFDRLAETVIQKTQYDAFFQTELDEMLQAQGVSDVVITGVMTHLCCETTARSAFMHGYQVWFPADGTATYNQEYHLGTLRNLAHGFAHIPLIGQLLAQLEGIDDER